MSAEILDSMLAQLASMTPLIAAAAASYLIDAVRRHVGEIVPAYLYPIVLPIVGAAVAGLAQSAGWDIGDFNPQTADLSVWQTVVAGAITGAATVGLKEARKSLKKARDARDDTIDYDAPYL